MNTELVSFVLPVYNAEKYLQQTLDSIAAQTWQNWELIAINDGSSDASEKILERFARLHPQTKLISRQNKGLIATLNEGIKAAKGEWIARIDADDICMPERIEKQLVWAKKHNAELCGGIIERIGTAAGNSWVFPSSVEGIYTWLLFRSAFAHPTVIIKRDLATRFPYSEKFKHAEDYELWTRLALGKTRMTNIPEKVLLYRIHDNQVSHTQNDPQTNTRIRLTREYWRQSPLTADLAFHDCLVDERVIIETEKFKNAIDTLRILQNRISDPEAINALKCHATWFLYRSLHLGGKTVMPAVKKLNISLNKKIAISVLATFKAGFLMEYFRHAAWIRWFPLKWFF